MPGRHAEGEKLSRGFPFEEEACQQRNTQQQYFARTVWKAKAAFYKKVISEITDTRDIFRATKWAQQPQRFVTPPLKTPEGHILVDTNEKIDLLMCTHASQSQLTDFPEPPMITDNPYSWSPFTVEEVRRSVLKPGNTAPGMDLIPNAALKCAWPILGNHITTLFNMSYQWGHVPASWKAARLCALPKGGQRDKSNPRSYRLISQLPTLSKAMERTLARKLAFQAIERRIIRKNYACAVPEQATTDLLLSLVDELEDEVLNRKNIATMTTFDVRGAFDAVGKNRMIRRLIEQNWPSKLCQWVSNFLSGRTADVSLDGQIGGGRELGGYLPQGSPISPILFMLYLAPLFREKPFIKGYADDGCCAVYSESFIVNIFKARRLSSNVQRWCECNGLELDLAKTSVMHLTRRQSYENPGITLPNNEVLQAISPTKSLKRLGVQFDRKLTFKPQMIEAGKKANRVVDGLQMLRGCFKGSPFSSLLQVVPSAVLPILTYGSQAWWRARGQTRNGTYTYEINKAVRRAARCALPVYQTTPIHPVHHGSGIPPWSKFWMTFGAGRLSVSPN